MGCPETQDQSKRCCARWAMLHVLNAAHRHLKEAPSMSTSGSEAEGFCSPASKGFSSSCCLAACDAARASATRGRVSVKTKMFDRVATAEMSAAPRHGSRNGLRRDQRAIPQRMDYMVHMMWRRGSFSRRYEFRDFLSAMLPSAGGHTMTWLKHACCLGTCNLCLPLGI